LQGKDMAVSARDDPRPPALLPEANRYIKSRFARRPRTSLECAPLATADVIGAADFVDR
jgi:hypothetical protein